MIPKAGDVVDINPLFKEAMRKRAKAVYGADNICNWGEAEDGHIYVVGMVNMGSFYCVIVDKPPGQSAFSIDLVGRPLVFQNLCGYGWTHDDQLYVPIGAEQKDSILDLKAANTQPGITDCAKCGSQLKNPVPGWDRMKYCPKCEP